jgi:hypothetical protein
MCSILFRECMRLHCCKILVYFQPFTLRNQPCSSHSWTWKTEETKLQRLENIRCVLRECDSNTVRLHHRLACYQLSYYRRDDLECFNKAYQFIVEKLENKIVYYRGTVECQHLIFWLVSQGRVHCHTAKLEPNWRVSVDEVPLQDPSESHRMGFYYPCNLRVK